MPSTNARLDIDQTTRVSTKRVWDGYVLWTLSPGKSYRQLGSNLSRREYVTTGVNANANLITGAKERVVSQGFSRNTSTVNCGWS